MVVDDLDDHLRRRHRSQHLLPERLLADGGDKVPDHGKRHIGLEQRNADLTQSGPYIGLGQRTVAAQPVEHVCEAITEAVEHPGPQYPHATAKNASARNSRTGGPGSLPRVCRSLPSEAQPERSRDAAFCQLDDPASEAGGFYPNTL